MSLLLIILFSSFTSYSDSTIMKSFNFTTQNSTNDVNIQATTSGLPSTFITQTTAIPITTVPSSASPTTQPTTTIPTTAAPSTSTPTTSTPTKSAPTTSTQTTSKPTTLPPATSIPKAVLNISIPNAFGPAGNTQSTSIPTIYHTVTKIASTLFPMPNAPILPLDNNSNSTSNGTFDIIIICISGVVILIGLVSIIIVVTKRAGVKKGEDSITSNTSANYPPVINQNNHNDMVTNLEYVDKKEGDNIYIRNLKIEVFDNSEDQDVDELSPRKDKKSDDATKGNIEHKVIDIDVANNEDAKIDDLVENKEHVTDTVQAMGYMDWNHEDVYNWIMSLDDGFFKEYEDVLAQSLKEEDVKGSDLKDVEHAHIKGWGIKQFKHKNKLWNAIVMLTNDEGK